MPLLCTQKSPTMITDGDRQDVGVELRCDDLETLERGEDRDRRRDRRVAVEERGAGDAEDDEERRPPPGGALREGEERERAPLAAVVGAQDQDDVLERDDQDQRPDQQRDDADHLAVGQPVRPAPRAEPSRSA